MTVALTVIVGEKTSVCYLSEKAKSMLVLQIIQEQLSINIGYVLDMRFMQIFQEC